jgi:precorrin-3B synthase
MSTPLIKGYCPGALRPMQSGDGLVVRIRPFNGLLNAEQATGLAKLSLAHGNGIIDLSSRANIQIRGVSEDTYLPLIEGLRQLSLIDAPESVESRRNVLVTPFWQAGDETEALATALTDALGQPDAPSIPHKFGFAIDTGPAPVLQAASADIRLERAADGGLLLVAQGMDTGKPVKAEQSIDEALALAHWFMNTRTTHTRMAKLLAEGVSMPPDFDAPRQTQTYVSGPGDTPQGALVGLAFGQLPAPLLADLAKQGDLRLTPWRMLLIENAHGLPRMDGLITDPDDPLLRVIACTGAPACAQALAETRALARTIAPHLRPKQFLHVSGCAKGCAHPKSATLTLTASQSGFDLIRNGRAGDTPDLSALTSTDIIKAL